MEDYTFDINDTGQWFEFIVWEGQLVPQEPLEPLKPIDEKDKFCLCHLRVNHPTHWCREIMETIQNLLDKGKISDKRTNDVPKPTAMMVS